MTGRVCVVRIKPMTDMTTSQPPSIYESHFLAIDLAHEIVTGQRTVEDARDRYVQAMQP